MDLGLSGAAVVVTGGAGGIGQGLVLGFAAEGANVVCASRDMTAGDALERRARDGRLAGQVRAVPTDVTDRRSVDAMVAKSHDIFGPIDVLINNAAVSTGRCTVVDLDEDARIAEVRTNIDGVVNCTQAVAPDMLGRQHGSVINIGSNAAPWRNGHPPAAFPTSRFSPSPGWGGRRTSRHWRCSWPPTFPVTSRDSLSASVGVRTCRNARQTAPGGAALLHWGGDTAVGR
jgi:NAD(P)-dependent dehydrogenase (short-subunit alcohol dehydrogenase family)